MKNTTLLFNQAEPKYILLSGNTCNKSYYIVHHYDADGITSAAIIYEYLIWNGVSDTMIKFISVDYSVMLDEALDMVASGDEIYFVDYSFSNKFNIEVLFNLAERCTVTWIDHHKTSFDFVNDNVYNIKGPKDVRSKIKNINYVITQAHSASVICYFYGKLRTGHMEYKNFYDAIKCVGDFGTYDIPKYIRYINSWDIWLHDMPSTKEFHYGDLMEDHQPDVLFDEIFISINDGIKRVNIFDKLDEASQKAEDKYIRKLIKHGRTIVKYSNVQNKSMLKDYGVEFSIVDDTNDARVYSVIAINKLGNSTMFGRLAEEYDLMMAYMYDGEAYTYSLYTTKDDVDCERLAGIFGKVSGFGGGGHKQAAGFRSTKNICARGEDVHIKKKLFNKNKYKIAL